MAREWCPAFSMGRSVMTGQVTVCSLEHLTNASRAAVFAGAPSYRRLRRTIRH